MFRSLSILPLSALFLSHLAMAGTPGQQEPGQQEPGQKPGQQEPGQQEPGQVHQCPKFGVQLGITVQKNIQYVYVHKLMNEHGTLARLGLHNGDIIYSLANQLVKTPAQVEQIMGALEMQKQQAGKPILVPLTIARGGQWYTWQATLN